MRQVKPALVTTVIAVYNRPQLIVAAVTSVLAQSYRPIEVIVVDDGSTDGTGAVCDSLAAAHPAIVQVLHRPNGGLGSALNAGLGTARGEFIQFLDSDDLIMPEKFAMQVAALRDHPECGLSYCYVREYVLGEPWSDRPARRSGETFERLFPALVWEDLAGAGAAVSSGGRRRQRSISRGVGAVGLGVRMPHGLARRAVTPLSGVSRRPARHPPRGGTFQGRGNRTAAP